MYYSIRFGTDGMGMDFDRGVFADSIDEARTEAAEALRYGGFPLQADKGLFTVHGHPAWILQGNEHGYRIVGDDSPAPEPRKRAIITIDADKYAQRIEDFVNNRPKLTPAEIAQLDQDIEDTFERLTEDLRQMRNEES